MKVSICCITYNHGKYIRKAIDSFLAQKRNFDIEILINDDASTDDTADIIREYEKQYPDIFPDKLESSPDCRLLMHHHGREFPKKTRPFA